MTEFDIEKARTFESCQEYEHCDAGGIIEAACAEITRLFAQGNRFAKKIDEQNQEIERLRVDLNSCAGYVGIGPNEGQLPIPERVRLCVNRMNGSVGRYEQELIKRDIRIDEQAKRIQELEKALIEATAKALCYAAIATAPAEANESGCRGNQDFRDMPKRWQSKFMNEAREQLHAEGLL